MRGWTWLAALLLVGCYVTHDAPNEELEAARAWEAATRTELCRRLLECEPFGSDTFWQFECRPGDGTGELGTAGGLAAVEAGEARFDAEAAAACLRVLTTGSGCGEWHERERCLQVFVPLLAPGDPCDPARRGCPGLCPRETCRCDASLPVGARCDTDEACASRRCDSIGAGRVCAAVECSGDGDSCADGRLCESGRCVPRPGRGEVCALLRPCVAGLACRDRVCGDERRAGEHCFDRSECPSSAPNCVAEVLGVCLPEPVPEGVPCEAPLVSLLWRHDDGVQGCGQALRCIPTSEPFRRGTCRRPVDYGDACSDTRLCPSPGRCVADRCVRVAMPDEPCDTQTACPFTFACAAGFCVPQPGEGERCDGVVPCLGSECRSGLCARDRAPLGAACDLDHSCEHGLYCEHPEPGAPGSCVPTCG